MKRVTAKQLAAKSAQSAPKNILCLAIDRLNADFLGAYGNAWIETPAFDALAAQSVVFDSYFTTSQDLNALYRGFWRGESPAAFDVESPIGENSPASLFRALKEQGYRTFVVSDSERVTLHSAIEDDYCDGRFYLNARESSEPAESLEDTRFFRNFEELARFIAKLEDEAEFTEPRPWFVWAHFSGWNDVWDFPLDARERYREDEEDPAPYAGTRPPFFPREDENAKAKTRSRGANGDNADDYDRNIAEESAASNVDLDALAALDPDDRVQSAVEAYAGGVAVLDKTLEGFTALLAEDKLLQKTLFVVTGVRGMGTGAPSALGFVEDREPNAQDDSDRSETQEGTETQAKSFFYAEECHMPLAIRLPDGTGATYRLPTLCEPRDVFETIKSWPKFANVLADPEFWKLERLDISPFAGEWSLDVKTDRSEQEALDANVGAEAEFDSEYDAPQEVMKRAKYEFGPDAPGQNLLALLVDESRSARDRVAVVAKDRGSLERALIVEDYFLKLDPNTNADLELGESRTIARLYVRPDDRYCVNDVASRCVDETERLEKEAWKMSENADV